MTGTGEVRVGVAGLGHWGPNLMRNFAALGALGAYCDPDAARHPRAEYPEARAYREFGEMLADPSLDAVAIATPAATHGRLTMAAIRAGKHVFVEKPLCLDLAEAETIRALAAEHGRRVMVGHLLLYHPGYRKLVEVVREGVLGDLRYIYSNRASLGKIRREENALWSFAPHDISMILGLVGGPPREVFAKGATYLHPGVPDITVTHMDFDGGISAHVFVSWLHPYKDQRLVVVGSRGMAVFDDVVQPDKKLQIYRHEAGWKDETAMISRAPAEAIAFPPTEPLREECTAFLAYIADGVTPPSDMAEGIGVLQVLCAAQASLHSHGPVALDQIPSKESGTDA